jgi:hypothetical protein
LIEHADLLNFDITECPGLNPFNMSDAAALLVAEIARPAHKTLIVVEESVDWDKVNRVLIETVLALDPTFGRTIFVHTKFNTMLQGSFKKEREKSVLKCVFFVGLYSSVDLSKYFSGIVRTHSATQSFWVTNLSQKCREGGFFFFSFFPFVPHSLFSSCFRQEFVSVATLAISPKRFEGLFSPCFKFCIVKRKKISPCPFCCMIVGSRILLEWRICEAF